MPKRKFEVSVAQIRVLSDPSRLRILAMLFQREMSISGLARSLGLTPATVHHHVRRLLAAGLIKPTRREIRGNLVEKYYTMPAKDIETAAAWEELRDSDKVAYRLAVLGMLKGMINDAMKAIQRRGTVEFEAGRLFFYRIPWRGDALLQVEEIFGEARARLERLEAKGHPEGESEVLALLTTLPS